MGHYMVIQTPLITKVHVTCAAYIYWAFHLPFELVSHLMVHKQLKTGEFLRTYVANLLLLEVHGHDVRIH
jgi:hypothetical protein